MALISTPRRSIRRKNEKVLKAIRPNAGLTALYQAKLNSLIDEMNRSVAHWVESAYRQNEPEVSQLAEDESPAAAMRAAIRKLASRWLKRFDDAAPKLADWFATKASGRSDAVLKKILKDGGFSVEWKMTRAMNDVVQATIGQNVSLIKSIPSQYLNQVEGYVMRSIQTGRDLGQLSTDLQREFGVTKRRAALIARTQNNLATASMTRVRQQEAGITEAIWVHSGGGKEPRPTHLKAGRDRQRYDVSKGWFDPEVGKNIWPGELINCRCVSRPVVKGFS
jgi:SPP1 gp7 family putative phage head morphogenesis protein